MVFYVFFMKVSLCLRSFLSFFGDFGFKEKGFEIFEFDLRKLGLNFK